MAATGRLPGRSANAVFVGVGVAFVAAYLVLTFFLMERSTWDTWGATIIAPALLLLSLPAFARQARREGNSKVFWFLTIALIVKMLFSIIRYYHAFHVVGKADSIAYDRIGSEIAMRFLDGNFNTGLETLLDTNFIRLFTGLVYTVIHPSVVSGFLIYGWLAFWGTYFFYRAFVLAVPDGNRASYRRWLFFLPSLLFWPSSIGKESWMTFGLGIAAFGAAKVVADRVLPGIAVSAIGIGLAALVRTPWAVAMGIGLVVGGLLRRPVLRPGQLRRPVAKLVTVAVFLGVGIILAGTLQDYVGRSGRESDEVGDLFETALTQTAQGDSEFAPVPITSPLGAPIAIVTVLFRPFPFEANTTEAVATSLEASVLMLFVALRFRSIWAAILGSRRRPYVAVAMVYVAGTIFAMASVANFGIIARQRTLIYPMVLVLLCIPPRVRRARRRSDRSTPEARDLPAAPDVRHTVGARA